ncbi:MAG: YdjY domain-containing protein [Planctomycetes bacterium]|nr:YdjY domain-containing protein [Planctomycetota bacterium]
MRRFLATALAAALASCSYAEDPKPDPAPAAEKIIKFPGGGRVLTRQKRVEIDGLAIYPTRAPIELFACATNGKEHEAIFSLECVPQDVHFALLIFGLKQKSDYPDKKGPQGLGDPAKPVGDRVMIWVEWEVDGKKHRVRAEDLLEYGPPANKRTMPRAGWTFAGSEVWERLDPDTNEKTGETIYMANRERTLIATLHDPTSVLDNPLTSGGDDRMLHPNFEALPPRGTKIVLAIELPTDEERAEMTKVEKEADDEYAKKIEKDWKDIEEAAPDQKGAEPVQDDGGPKAGEKK